MTNLLLPIISISVLLLLNGCNTTPVNGQEKNIGKKIVGKQFSKEAVPKVHSSRSNDVEVRHALVVGNGNYKHVGLLSNTIPDANRVAEALRALNFEVMEVHDLDLRSFSRAIADYEQALFDSNGVGFFYYSGHGIQLEGKNYLLPIDADLNSLSYLASEAINLDELLNALHRASNQLNVVILDACRNNPFADQIYTSKKNILKRGLAVTNAPYGTLVAFSTQPGNIAIDNGLYSSSLAQQLAIPGEQIENIFKKVRRKVRLASKNEQIPWEQTSLEGIFVPNQSYDSSLDSQLELTPPVEKNIQKTPLATLPEPLNEISPDLNPKMINLQAGCYSHHSEGANRFCVDEPFAIGQYEVTFSEYDQFSEETGRDKPSDEGWGRGDRPVVNVSWHDASEYAQWLSDKTGLPYRLPTEIEWEYAARAGTTTKIWWGDDMGNNRANCDGCGSQWDDVSTAPVGSFKPNPWGLYDTAGNVSEWTCSQWSNPFDGSESRCQSFGLASRVNRGGSWYHKPQYLKSSRRGASIPDLSNDTLGFRLALSIKK